MTHFRFGASAAALACATMIIAPAFAAPRPKPRPPVPITIALSARPATADWKASDEVVDYRRWRRDRHRGGIDGGDLLGGLLILGTVAAAAAAIDKDKRERRRERTRGRDYPYPQRPYDYRDGERYRDQPRDYGRAGGDPREADRAVDACEAEAGRTGRVDEIFEVEQIGGEWRVRGDFSNGREFTCSVDASGRAYVGTDWNAEADPRPLIGVDDDEHYAAGRDAGFEDSLGR